MAAVVAGVFVLGNVVFRCPIPLIDHFHHPVDGFNYGIIDFRISIARLSD